jgi:hypothetical protein
VLFSTLNHLYFTSVLPEVFVRCPLWLFSVVPGHRAFLGMSFRNCLSDIEIVQFIIFIIIISVWYPSNWSYGCCASHKNDCIIIIIVIPFALYLHLTLIQSVLLLKFCRLVSLDN